ncbi:MAG TPA: DEAD/DEAH box helicase [Pyrinomonadaceae bacterium]
MQEEINESSFEQFGLSEELIKAINDVGYETPSPIQLKTIPLLLAGKDMVGQAQTGTGKTAAFALPILERLDVKNKGVQALVLTPTRELAIQVAEAFHTYSKYLGQVRALPVYGGQSISQQIRHLRNGVQIIVGTPGRVMDHMRRETIDLSNLKIVTLDEADEMLRMGFIDDIEWILSHTPETRQTALFSATMPREIRRIAERYLNEPENVQIERKTLTVPTVQQLYINVSEAQKTDALSRLLEADSTPGEATLIFHRTKVGAAELTVKLQARGYAAEAMHGDMNQAQREALIRRLRNGQVEIVVATDVAARGLDVERIATVINYDMPSDTESYVHRIGRTGRAGREGKAVLFVTPRQQRMKRDIEQYTKQKIEPMKLPSQADVAARRVAMFKERLLKTLTEGDLELHLSLVEDLAEESGYDFAEIAAAASFIASGDKPLEVAVAPEPEQMGFGTDGMVRLFIGVGRNHRVGPADIVGAIANEADVPGKAIGAIDVYDRFTLVDVPAEYARQVLQGMSNTRIRNERANVRVAVPNDVAEDGDRRPPKREKAPRSSAAKTVVKSRAKKYSGGNGGTKPPKRKKTK